MPALLGYWDTRGLAHPARFLLEYTGTPYDEKIYEVGPGPKFDKSCWYDVKFKLGFDFPNLPYYIDGDVKVSQSNAILRYIGRKNGLAGNTEEERVRIDVLENQISDLRNRFVKFAYVDLNTKEYIEFLRNEMELLSEFLGNRKWFAGTQITYVDFMTYEYFYQQVAVDKDLFQKTPNLADFMKRFEALPAIKKYMASPKFIKTPINNKMAKFGYK